MLNLQFCLLVSLSGNIKTFAGPDASLVQQTRGSFLNMLPEEKLTEIRVGVSN